MKKEEIIKAYIDAYNRFDVEGMLKDLHEAIHFRNIANHEVNLEITDKEAFRAQAEEAKSLFLERTQTIEDITIDGNKVEVAINYEGKLAVNLPNGLNAGDWLRLKGKSIFYFDESGLIIGIDDIS